ncbi:MAG TPA: SDR family oxidoreductase [Terriglobales bacterium]|nr:SDR family oxidoreductase [Terriglobales bacterium]
MNTTILQPRINRMAAEMGAGLGEKPLAGKVIAITGASSGIGAATARLLALAGAHVIMGARRLDRLAQVAEEITAERGSVRYHHLDVVQPAEMGAFIATALDEFGRLDVLINNAGVLHATPLSAVRTDEWDRMIDVNLRGALYGVAAVLPVMQAQGEGQIINIAGSVGQNGPQTAVYAATKAAIRAISDGLRQEHEGIRVTLVNPTAAFSELADHIADPAARCEMRAQRSIAISAESVARTILFAIAQPAAVDVGEITVRPTANPF